MAESNVPPQASTASAAPAPDLHAPAVSSPLNPNPSTANTNTGSQSRQVKPIVREQREKKDSLKKREAALAAVPDSKTKSTTSSSSSSSTNAVVTGIAAATTTTASQNSSAGLAKSQPSPSPLRYAILDPRHSDYDPPKEPIFSSHEPTPTYTPDGNTELKKSVDHAENKRAYRYRHCVADPLFIHKQYYRQSEPPPFTSRMSVEDSDRNIHFDSSTRIITNEKGWRMSRANVFAREGSLYYEVKILKGVPAEGPIVPPGQEHLPQPHIRMGWARREAPLDAPVGFDGYSYGITDIRFETMHRSRSGKFISPTTTTKTKSKSKATNQKQDILQQQTTIQDVRTNDVIGLLITLPPLGLHHKVVQGIYNPAVDFSTDAPDPNAPASDIIRDRIPVPYRGNVYFEQFDYQPTKPILSYSDRTPINTISPHPNHNEPALRCLPGSNIKVYKNGEFVGKAFENLMSFLPPSSIPAGTGVRTGFDDGSLGYYPAVSAFSGGMAEVNFGPDFWFPPPDLNLSPSETNNDVQMGGITDESSTGGQQQQSQPQPQGLDIMRPRPISDRYREQVAEDVVWDIIDECDFFVQDGGYAYVPESERSKLSSLSTAVVGNLQDDGASPANSSPINGLSTQR